jgi:hypothetical protein
MPGGQPRNLSRGCLWATKESLVCLESELPVRTGRLSQIGGSEMFRKILKLFLPGGFRNNRFIKMSMTVRKKGKFKFNPGTAFFLHLLISFFFFLIFNF